MEQLQQSFFIIILSSLVHEGFRKVENLNSNFCVCQPNELPCVKFLIDHRRDLMASFGGLALVVVINSFAIEFLSICTN